MIRAAKAEPAPHTSTNSGGGGENCTPCDLLCRQMPCCLAYTASTLERSTGAPVLPDWRSGVLLLYELPPGARSESVRVVCVDALVRICGGEISNDRPYRDSCCGPEVGFWEVTVPRRSIPARVDHCSKSISFLNGDYAPTRLLILNDFENARRLGFWNTSRFFIGGTSNAFFLLQERAKLNRYV